MLEAPCHRPQTRQPQSFIGHDGFSLAELMVVILIVVIATVGVSASFRTFTRHGSTSLRENEQKMAIEATLQLLKRDLNMAGFGLPSALRLAEDDAYETAIESDFASGYDCNQDGDSNDSITEACLNYDLDDDGDNDNTTNLTRDRLFIANGWTILNDITINNAIDGDITTDYYYKVAIKKENGGYFARLVSDVSAGDTFINVDDVDINRGDEYNGNTTDFKRSHTASAVIIYGQDGSGNYSLKGVPVGNVDDNTSRITFSSGESIDNDYVANTTKVVPAIMWYIKDDDGILWLYRSRCKVLPDVIGFQVMFGYDRKADGLEWYPVVPAPSVDGETDLTTILKALRAVRIVMVLKRESKNKSSAFLRTYEEIVLLKN